MFEEDVYNSMDFEPGATYSFYMSYYLGRPDGKDTNKYRTFAGELNDKGEPVFRKLYINTLKGVLEEEEEEVVVTTPTTGGKGGTAGGGGAAGGAGTKPGGDKGGAGGDGTKKDDAA